MVYLKDLVSLKSLKKKSYRGLSSAMDPETVSSLSLVVPKLGSGDYEIILQTLVGETSFALVSISGKVTDSSTGNGVSGVTVSLNGTDSNSVSTGDDGAYSFTNIQNGSYTITPSGSGIHSHPKVEQYRQLILILQSRILLGLL